VRSTCGGGSGAIEGRQFARALSAGQEPRFTARRARRPPLIGSAVSTSPAILNDPQFAFAQQIAMLR
jgi:hypothetical protein